MTSRAAELRDEFNRGFAAAPLPPEPAQRDVLCMRVAGEVSAILLDDIASLHADLHIVALPTRAAELLGVAAIRGAVVPIYDLGIAFFGAGRRGAAAVLRWTVLVRSGAAGFAFESYEGHARIVERAIAAPAQRGHSRGQIAHDGHARSIIDLGSVLTAIETRWRRTGPAKDP